MSVDDAMVLLSLRGARLLSQHPLPLRWFPAGTREVGNVLLISLPRKIGLDFTCHDLSLAKHFHVEASFRWPPGAQVATMWSSWSISTWQMSCKCMRTGWVAASALPAEQWLPSAHISSVFACMDQASRVPPGIRGGPCPAGGVRLGRPCAVQAVFAARRGITAVPASSWRS